MSSKPAIKWFIFMLLRQTRIMKTRKYFSNRRSHRRFSLKSVVKIFTKFVGNHLCRSLFLIKRDSGTGIPFSCEFCQIFENSVLPEHLRETVYSQSSTNFQILHCIISALRYYAYSQKSLFLKGSFLVT